LKKQLTNKSWCQSLGPEKPEKPAPFSRQDDLYSERIRQLAVSRPEILSEDGDEGHWRILGGHQGLAEKMAQP